MSVILSILVALICESHGANEDRVIVQLNQRQRDVLLDQHNYWRRKTAKGNMLGDNNKKHPSAKSMIELQWDEALAWSAANYAGECKHGHDTDAERKARFVRARVFEASFDNWDGQAPGQNIAHNQKQQWTGSSTQLKQRISNWYSIESKNIDLSGDIRYGKAPCSKTPYYSSCGHFTNGVWAETKYVGCGVVKKCDARAYTLICNYWPGGNTIGVQIYAKGSTASACPSGWTRKNNGLCAQSGSRLTMEEEEAAEANRLGLILGLCGAALVLIIVGSVVFFCWRKKKKTHKVIKDEMEMGTKGETVPNESGEDEEEEIDVDEQETIEITV